jgi:hypothetical protein
MPQSIAISKKNSGGVSAADELYTTVAIAAIAEKTASMEICPQLIILSVSLISLMMRMP